jgi:hypothetical protein
MSSSTLAQIAQKPITVTTDEAISNFADSRQGRVATLLGRPDRIRVSAGSGCASIIAAGLSDDNDALMS